VAITCQVTGETVRGPQGSSGQWYQLTSGVFVAGAYVRTSGVPACPIGAQGVKSNSPTITTYTGKVTSGDGSVRLRAGASTGSAVVGQVANGTTLTFSCSVTGTVVRGTVSTTGQWDRTTNNTYISHAYIASGLIAACSDGSSNVTPEPNRSMTNAQFIAASVAPAQRARLDYGVPASVTIAQAIIESGWGRSSLAANDHNYFGIKCSGNNHGPIAIGCRSYSTRECGSTCGITASKFRVYATITDSFRDHAVFLASGSRYRGAFAYSANPDQFLNAIWRAGYATDPNYGSLITGVMRRYNLYQYDQR
jgi:flagellar protein FlgJ